MDINDFITMGECDFGSIWRVQSEDKVVVNVYQIAVYFSTYDFFKFAKMVESATKNLAQITNVPPNMEAPPLMRPKSTVPTTAKTDENELNTANISNIRQFRVLKKEKDEEESQNENYLTEESFDGFPGESLLEESQSESVEKYLTEEYLDDDNDDNINKDE